MVSMTEEDAQNEKLTLENMRVFQMNDCDWVAAPSKEAAINWYVRETELPADECIDEPVKECSLDTECWAELGNPERGRTTYRAIIEEYLRHHNAEPFMCASTEY